MQVQIIKGLVGQCRMTINQELNIFMIMSTQRVLYMEDWNMAKNSAMQIHTENRESIAS